MRIPVLLCLLAAPLFAQTSNTSPRGLDTTEGNGTFFHWGGTTGRQMRVYDNTQRTHARMVRSIAFRRNGTSASAGPARMMDVKIVLAEADMSILSSDLSVAVPGGRTVLDAKNINFPDWTASTPMPPAKFDFILRLNTPFAYTGQQAFVWDLTYRNSTVSGSALMDRDSTSTRRSLGQVLGTGCSGFTHGLQLENSGPASPSFGMHLRVDGTGAPNNAPAFLFVDFQDRNATIPGVCVPVRAFPTILLPAMIDAAGNFRRLYISLPYTPAAQGVRFFTQLVAVDPSQTGIPVRLSNARQATMPTNTTRAGHEACYIWRTNGSTAIRLATFGGCPVTQLQ